MVKPGQTDPEPSDPPTYAAWLFARFVLSVSVAGLAWMTGHGAYLVLTDDNPSKVCETNFDGICYCFGFMGLAVGVFGAIILTGSFLGWVVMTAIGTPIQGKPKPMEEV